MSFLPGYIVRTVISPGANFKKKLKEKKIKEKKPELTGTRIKGQTQLSPKSRTLSKKSFLEEIEVFAHSTCEFIVQILL